MFGYLSKNKLKLIDEYFQQYIKFTQYKQNNFNYIEKTGNKDLDELFHVWNEKIKMTDAAIEVALANREGFFNPIQSVQVKSTRFTLEKVVELVKANNEIIYDQCSTPNTGIYVIKYLPPANVVEGLRKEFLSNYKKELKAQQAKELEKIINGLTLEYAAKLELKAEKEKQAVQPLGKRLQRTSR